ncbi:DUF7204 family protein [Streptococcus gallolyticus]|nr:hypothetical protein [Streptococcus gallolyticus]MCO7178934.1 hypothetical protein [Streptococcus gallolyticus]
MYEVVLYFDNMVDDVRVFETKEAAKAEADILAWKYRHSRLYRVEVRKSK